jgi:hypothetical protein
MFLASTKFALINLVFALAALMLVFYGPTEIATSVWTFALICVTGYLALSSLLFRLIVYVVSQFNSSNTKEGNP